MEVFNAIAESNQWHTIWPEISLAILALFLLVVGLFIPHRKRLFIPSIAIGGQILILLLTLGYWEKPTELYSFGGLIAHVPVADSMRIFFLVSSLFVSYLAVIYFKKNSLPKLEFYHILLIATASLMLVARSNHFVMLFVALETFTVCLFVLISYCRTSQFSLEAGLKFLILAALSSSILLFGIVILYGAAGNPELASVARDPMNFQQLTEFIFANQDNSLIRIGSILVICGIAFKIGVVPFQIWIPDVYQGAPTPVTALLAVSSKAAGVIIFLNLIEGPFKYLEALIVPLLSAIAIVTILFGNITALPQSNVKRLMGLSGIAHAGYILLGIVSAYYISWAVPVVIFYLFTYLLGSFCVFGVMAHVSGHEDADQDLADYENLAHLNPFLGAVLLVGLGSLAGIPPLVGFIGKLFLFMAAFKAGLYVLLAVSIIGVVISIYYYFGWIRDAFFFYWRPALNEEEEQAPEKQPIRLTLVHRVILGSVVGITFILGIYQGVIGNLMQ